MADSQINARDPSTGLYWPLKLFDNGDGTYSLIPGSSDIPTILNNTDFTVTNLGAIEDGVYYDDTHGESGTDWPTGTAQHPSNNVADVLTMCAARNLRRINLSGLFTLPSAPEPPTDMSGFRFFGSGMSDIVDFGDGTTNIDGAWFENCTIKGTQGGSAFIFGKSVVLNGVRNMCAVLSDVTLRDRLWSGDIAFAVRDGGFVDIRNAVVVFSDAPTCGGSIALIDFNNATALTGVAIIGFKGMVGIRNMTNSNSNFVIAGEDNAYIFGDVSNTQGCVYIDGYCTWFGGGVYSSVWDGSQSVEFQNKLDNTLGPYTMGGWIGHTLPNLLAKLGDDSLTIKERFDNLDTAIASIGGGVNLSGTMSFDESLVTEQIMQTCNFTTNTRVNSIWIDASNITRNFTIKMYSKIDGTNYREFQTNSWTTADSDGILIDGFLAPGTDFEIRFTSVGGGGTVSVPWRII